MNSSFLPKCWGLICEYAQGSAHKGTSLVEIYMRGSGESLVVQEDVEYNWECVS